MCCRYLLFPFEKFLTVSYSDLQKPFPTNFVVSCLFFLATLNACVSKEDFDLPATDYDGFVQISSELAGADAVFCGVGSEFPVDTIVSSCLINSLENRNRAYGILSDARRQTATSVILPIDPDVVRYVDYDGVIPDTGESSVVDRLSLSTCNSPKPVDTNFITAIGIFDCEGGIRSGY